MTKILGILSDVFFCWRHAPFQPKIDILFILGLPQDVGVLLPLITEAHQRQISFRILIPQRLQAIYSMIALLPYRDFIEIAAGDRNSLRQTLFRLGPKSMISGAESSAKPHRFAHRLTQIAKIFHIRTYTLQHGFENVGINYIDTDYGDRIVIGSDIIFLWNRIEALPSLFAERIGEKCVATGRAILDTFAPLPASFQGKQMVSIFENLHWTRYEDSYRTAFGNALLRVATRFPRITFILKPHPSSFWLGQFKLAQTFPENLHIIDRQIEEGQKLSAKDWLKYSVAAITTPSSIALDAASMGKPVAIAAFGMDLPAYQELPLLNTTEEWEEFITQATTDPKKYQDMSMVFAQKSMLPGNATSAIIDYVMDRKI